MLTKSKYLIQQETIEYLLNKIIELEKVIEGLKQPEIHNHYHNYPTPPLTIPNVGTPYPYPGYPGYPVWTCNNITAAKMVGPDEC